MNLYLVRHGQTKSNSEGRYLGNFEDELSQQGIDEINKVREFTKNVNFDVVFSSEKKRAIDTAKILFDREATIDFRLNERNFGIFENKTYSEICSAFPMQRKAWEADWINYKIPEGESVKEAYARVVDFMKLLEKENYENCLVVTHGGIIRLIYCYLLGQDLNLFWKFLSKNGSISILKFQYGNWHIHSIIQ